MVKRGRCPRCGRRMTKIYWSRRGMYQMPYYLVRRRRYQFRVCKRCRLKIKK